MEKFFLYHIGYPSYDRKVVQKKIRLEDLAEVLEITYQSLYPEVRRCLPKCYIAADVEVYAKEEAKK